MTKVVLLFFSFTVGIFFANRPTFAQVTSTLFIVSPSPGEVVAGSTVSVDVRMPEGFTLVSLDAYTEHVEGEGHLHVWLDAPLPSHDDGLSQVLSDEPAHTYENVFSGLHTIYAEFYRNDHLPYEPRLFDQVEFETYRENLAPRDNNDSGEVGAPPVSSGGLFLPPEGGNTILAMLIIAITIGILWFMFGKNRKSHK